MAKLPAKPTSSIGPAVSFVPIIVVDWNESSVRAIALSVTLSYAQDHLMPTILPDLANVMDARFAVAAAVFADSLYVLIGFFK